MASSGDELGSYEHSRSEIISGTSKAISRPIAGPSKPSSKRKKAGASETVGTSRGGAVNAIHISSDEEEVLPASKRGKAAPIPSAPRNGPTNPKGKERATAPAKRRTVVDTDEVDAAANHNPQAATNPTITSLPGRSKNTPVHVVKTDDSLRRRNELLEKQLQDVTKQRDSMSSQLEGLFQLRHTEAEKLLVEQKAQYDAYLKVKDETIKELQSSSSRMEKSSASGATTTLHFLTREAADEEKLDMQHEVTRLNETLKKKDETIRAKEIGIADLTETVQVLRSDLKFEIEKSKEIAGRNSSAVKPTHKSSDAKNALAIRLYEELTNLLITNVRHEPGMFREDEAIYTCVQTTPSGKSLNFELRFSKEVEESEDTSSGNNKGRRVGKVIYTPLLLEHESEEFVQQLDFLAGPFTFQEEQMSVFTKTLLTYLEGEAEDMQSSGGQLEADGD